MSSFFDIDGRAVHFLYISPAGYESQVLSPQATKDYLRREFESVGGEGKVALCYRFNDNIYPQKAVHHHISGWWDSRQWTNHVFEHSIALMHSALIEGTLVPSAVHSVPPRRL